MAQPEEAHDPSMEEILASIRRIIAEDTGEASARPPHLSVVPSPAEEPESPPMAKKATVRTAKAEVAEPVTEVAEPPADEDNASAGMETTAPELDAASEADEAVAEAWSQELDDFDADPQFTEEPEAAVEAAADDEDDSPPAPAKGSADLDAITAAMTAGKEEGGYDSAAARLLSPQADRAVHTAFDQLASTILSNQARTLEDLVKDMMRPMLKHWLDDNLPVLVERLVREEIERVSRGRR